MDIIDTIQQKVDKLSDGSDQSLGKVIDDKVKNLFKVMSGAGTKVTRIPDNVIAFIGAAGGVGTSTIVANVAETLKLQGYSVLIIDANTIYPVQYNYTGYQLAKIGKTDLIGYLTGRCNIADTIRNEKPISLLTSCNRTIMDLVSADKQDRVDEFGETLTALRDMFDFILIDVPNTLMVDLVHTCLYLADAIYIIWDENLSCIMNTETLKKNMLLCGISYDTKIRMILNKRTSVQYPGTPIMQSGMELVGILPFDTAIIQAGLSSKVFITGGESMSKTAKAFSEGISEITTRIMNDAGRLNTGAAAPVVNTAESDQDFGAATDLGADDMTEAPYSDIPEQVAANDPYGMPQQMTDQQAQQINNAVNGQNGGYVNSGYANNGGYAMPAQPVQPAQPAQPQGGKGKLWKK